MRYSVAHFYLKLDKIKNWDFNSFSSQEKYALLVLLMKYLLPLVNINFNSTSNIGKDLFKTILEKYGIGAKTNVGYGRLSRL